MHFDRVICGPIDNVNGIGFNKTELESLCAALFVYCIVLKTQYIYVWFALAESYYVIIEVKISNIYDVPICRYCNANTHKTNWIAIVCAALTVRLNLLVLTK